MIPQKIISSAAEQVAADYNCAAYDFYRTNTKLTYSSICPGQRVFSYVPDAFKAATFGKNAVISVSPSLMEFAETLSVFDGTRLFDGGGVAAANSFLAPRGYIIGQIRQYYLPSDNFKVLDPRGYKLNVFNEDEIKEMLYPYNYKFENALMYSPIGSRRDVLAVCAISGRSILGMAGASSDSELFRQIGVDVIPECRGKGLGPILVSTLANEIFLRGQIPYYGTWPGNIFSQNTALKSGFLPAWTEMRSIEIRKRER